ncbi:MAG TPA: response regulator transcription factor [Flexivirga sp.]|uniref:response regulator transcription factor n=1 Tax=Flexivirga sp. TaxID=1962927 RepID=UPI002C02DA52|nr:response regulator transcription factor [Flexivirga sp.]HWC24519.1 response regulator transcription factor [Flexivirga sp.]
MTNTNVLIVDDHPLFRSGLAGLIETIPGLTVSGSVGTAEEAVAAVTAEPPDVVLMDLSLPGLSGVEGTRAILASHPRIAVLVITMVDDDDSVFAAVSAGARGYVLKGAPAAEIAAAIHTVAAGGAVFGAELAGRLLTRRPPDGPAVATPGGGLTPREVEILTLIGTGASNHQIARSLGLSVKTVQNRVSRILDKLHAADRTSAALKARGLQP